MMAHRMVPRIFGPIRPLVVEAVALIQEGGTSGVILTARRMLQEVDTLGPIAMNTHIASTRYCPVWELHPTTVNVEAFYPFWSREFDPVRAGYTLLAPRNARTPATMTYAAHGSKLKVCLGRA